MTLIAEPGTQVRVCVVSVDTQGFGAELLHRYFPYRNKGVAILFAGRYVAQMQAEGPASFTRGVFVEQENGNWETVGSYYDV